MSAVKEAITAMRDMLLLQDEVKRAAKTLERMSDVIGDHEKRLIRLETRWETAVELVALKRDQGRLES